jgi:hypothetical protein
MKIFHYSRKLVFDTESGELLTFKEFEQKQKEKEKESNE